MSRYAAAEIRTPRIANRFGYAKEATLGHFTITDEYGYPVRVHDGFAVFTTKQQADWCAELANGAFNEGGAHAREVIREALGVKEPDE